MLASMRKALKKGLLQFVVWFTFIAMVLTYSLSDIINLVQKVFGLHNYVISVDGKGLTKEEFFQKESEIKQRIEAVKQKFGPYAKMILQMYGLKDDPQAVALSEVGQELFLDKIVNKYNIKIEDNYLKQSLISQLPKEIVDENGNIDQQALNQILKNVRLSDFEKKFAESLKRNVALELINGAVFVPEYLIESKYKDYYFKKSYALLKFDLKKYVDKVKKDKVSEADLKDFFQKNKSNYVIPEERVATVWKFSLSNYDINVSQKEIENYYNKNKNRYIESPSEIDTKRIVLKFAGKNPSELRQKATQIKTELVQNPNKFSDLAKEYSDDKESAQKGGSIGFIKKGQLEPALDEALFSLESDNQTSDVIRTEEGLEILQRVSRKPTKYKPLSKVESEIKKEIESKKFTSLFNLEAKKISRKAKKDPVAFEDFAKRKKADKQEITFKKGDGSKITPKLFSLREGSYGFYLEGETGYIFKLDKIIESHLPKFTSILKKVEEEYYKDKAQQLLKNDARRAQAKNEDFKSFYEEFDTTLSFTPLMNAESKSEIEELNKKGVPTDELLNISSDKPKILDTRDGGAFLVKIDKVEASPVEFAKKKALEKELYSENRNSVERGFIASLAKNAKIKVNINEINKKTKRYNER